MLRSRGCAAGVPGIHSSEQGVPFGCGIYGGLWGRRAPPLGKLNFFPAGCRTPTDAEAFSSRGVSAPRTELPIGVRVGTAYTGPWVRERSRTLILEHGLLFFFVFFFFFFFFFFFALEPNKAYEMA